MEDSKLIKAESISDLLESCPINETIGNNLVKAFAKINQHESAVCSISGGSDSDVMLDIVWRCDKDDKVTYVWFDTGLEYQATKDHLKYLEEKYGIKISVRRAIKPIPTTCKQYGQPFLSKHVSEMIRRLKNIILNGKTNLLKNYIKSIQNVNLHWSGGAMLNLPKHTILAKTNG